MSNAPEKIWATYPVSGKRIEDTIYGYGTKPFGPNDEDWFDDDFDDPCMVAEYTRTVVADARIAELETALEYIADHAGRTGFKQTATNENATLICDFALKALKGEEA